MRQAQHKGAVCGYQGLDGGLWDPRGVTGVVHTVSTPSLRDSPPVITAPAPYQYPVSAFSPRFAEGTKGRKGWAAR